ncbi:MAG: GntR family transcriptional regulator [Candidatus Methylacidiphilales bacterium]
MSTPIVTEPVYQQLARLCRQALVNGTYAPGDRFPSERELAEKYKVSRATANKVISNMVAEGLLQFRPGIGTFVLAPAKALHTSLREMESFTEHAQRLGLRPDTRVLSFHSLIASNLPSPIRQGLGLPKDSAETVIYVRRLRLANREPVILEDRWLRASFVPRLTEKKLRGSLYQLLESEYQLRLGGERHRIRAQKLTRQEATLLGGREGDAALVVEGPGFAADGDIIWFEILYYRGDRCELVNEVLGPSSVSTTTVQLCPDL